MYRLEFKTARRRKRKGTVRVWNNQWSNKKLQKGSFRINCSLSCS